MKAALGWRSVVTVAVLVGSILILVTQPLRLGLDLRGGTQVVLEAQDTDAIVVDASVMDRSLEALRRRVDGLGVSEPSLQRSGDRRIIVELPGLDDPDEAVATIGRTGRLSFHPVVGLAPPDAVTGVADADGSVVLADDDGVLIQLGPPVLEGADVSDAQVDLTGATWAVSVDFANGGAWAALTGAAACAPPGDPQRRVAIVLDGDVLTSPQVGAEVGCQVGIQGGSTVITGQFTESDARELALLIRSGALPVPLEIIAQNTVGPTLGAAAIDASLWAAAIGSLLTVLFLIAYYRYLGVLAALALAAYAVISLATLQALGAVLTLPGIAGFVLAIGMAVDGNVLVFERIKEEHAAGRTLRNSARAGFRRAFTAIADSNVTTLVAALLLYFFASGGVRGFGITLSIGVLASMFTTLVITRMMIDVSVQSKRMTKSPKVWGMNVGARLRERILERGPNLVARRRIWFMLSALAVATAALGIGVRGVEYGLEFTGGRLIEYQIDGPVELDDVRENLAAAGFPRAIVQQTGDTRVSVRVNELETAEEQAVTNAVTDAAGPVTEVRDEFVGPTIGNELRQRALIALGLALLAQLAYLAVRFRWTYGTSAVVAVFHDAIIVIGVFAWLGKSFDGVFVASLLTVIGYSINDTVVIFDRIRERRQQWPEDTFSESANEAVLETLPRTINTGLSTLFILVSLWVLGGDTLADFALALIIGVVVGTYSSMLTAMPLATVLERSAPSNTRKIRRTPSERNRAAAEPIEPAVDAESEHSNLATAQTQPATAIPPRPRKKRPHNRPG
jgi:SecD/SecF fusion protein